MTGGIGAIRDRGGVADRGAVADRGGAGDPDSVRVAAVGDLHIDENMAGAFRPALLELGERADLLLLAGDLTRHGSPEEAACVAREFADLPVPVITVLGNHDYHSDLSGEVVAVLRDAGLTVLDGDGLVLDLDGGQVGVAGLPGFGGGFAGRCVTAFGEPQTKAFAEYGRQQANRLAVALDALECDLRIALTHYAPTPDTLVGEPLEIYPFLGSYLLGGAIDQSGVAIAFHGHAHAGSPRGFTQGGVPVRNVAHPVLHAAYQVFDVPFHGGSHDAVADRDEPALAVARPSITVKPSRAAEPS